MLSLDGKLYQFDKVEVVSAGDRDPDADDVTGMSASKQRKAAAEEEIVLRGQTLAYKLQTYLPEDIDENDVDDKIYLAKIEEIGHIQEDVVGKIDKFLYKFPQTGRRLYYENLYQKALSDVRNYKSRVNA